MIKEFSFSFQDLDFDQKSIARLLGYSEGHLPEPFGSYLAEAIARAEMVTDICGAIYHAHDVVVADDKSRMMIEGVEFGIGKTVAKELRNAESLILFICTAGKEISELSRELMLGDDPVLGYVYDVLGSVLVEAATDRMQEEVRKMAQLSGELITNRYSPGYCQWSVADQHKLFSFFPENCCGISLTDSALMHPIKSVSGFIGQGKNVKFRQYTCNLCSITECFYRNRQLVNV